MKRTNKKRSRPVRDAPKQQPQSCLVSMDAWLRLCGEGYRPLIECPEVQICIGVYADLIGAMTLRLMQNGDNGDVRIRNGLSRKIDIDPSRNMTRITFMQHIVRVLLSNGNQITYPIYKDGYLDDLQPLRPGAVSLIEDGNSYFISYGEYKLDPDEVLHFALNPDTDQPWRGTGLTITLRDAVASLRQANATRHALMESPAPSIIVKVDSMNEELSSVDGRRKMGEQYLDSSENGRPWFIPAEAFSVEQVKPMTLEDLAIAPNLEIDKRSIAAAFGVPAFLVGVGEYNEAAYRHFVSTKLMAVAKVIEQELTKKLLYADDLYWKFNPMSLYSYSLSELVNSGKEMVDRMALRRNEWRDWIGLSPDEEMNELEGLENYIPASMLGQQKKLKTGGENNEE